jgi:hypothetical protein
MATPITAIIRRNTLTNALRTAASIYDEDANHIIYAKEGDTWLAQDRVVQQFRRQADEARALADTIDQSDKIELRD